METSTSQGAESSPIPIEKRPLIYAEVHSKAALDQSLLADEVVPDRVGSLLQQYPFLAPYFDTPESQFEYDNAPYYENARWLILTMAELLRQGDLVSP